MIFYFSGTGNSLHVAEALREDEKEKIVDIAKVQQKGKYGFHIRKGEAVGLVCPVYYSGIPRIMLEFIRHVRLKDDYGYIYLVLTHGGGPGGAAYMTWRELKKRGYHMSACFDIRMPRNYIFIRDAMDPEEEDQRIRDAEPVICDIREAVIRRETTPMTFGPGSRLCAWTMYPLCEMYMPVRKFYTDDRCIGCGVCASRCPEKCIEMIDGRPVWTKKRCIRCMSCLRCNAIQYGNVIKDRRRYRYHAVGDHAGCS